MITNPNNQRWIDKGYELFAMGGLAGLKIEPLAKRVGTSKSSFYHHFADLDLFVDTLLQYHLQQAHLIAEKERRAQKVNPDLIHVLIEHKIDLLFNRQLRIHQNRKSFADALNQSNEIVGDAFVNTWVKDLGTTLTPQQLHGIFSLALENFYLQINIDNLTYPWLSAYFDNLKKIIQNFTR